MNSAEIGPPAERPRRPRLTTLIVAVVMWALLNPLLDLGMQHLGASKTAAQVSKYVLFTCIFTALGIWAWREHRALQQSGRIPPPRVPTRKQLIATTLFMVAFWSLWVWLIWGYERFAYPLIPLLGTIALIYQTRIYRRRRTQTPSALGEK